MKLVCHSVKKVVVSVLAVVLSALSLNVLAESGSINENNASAQIRIVQGYRPVARVVPELAQIVFFYPKGEIPATIYVDRELQSALMPGEFTVFCVAPGPHAIESYFNDKPLYEGKKNPARQINARGGETYFLHVNPGTRGSTTALEERATAEEALRTMRKQTRIINRASQVKPCEYVNGNDVVLIQESILFRFAKGNYAGIVPESVAKLNNIVRFLRQGNGIKEIQLVGYTDAIGNRDANLRLSEERAQTVLEALVRSGVSPNIIRNISGMGVAQAAEGCGVSASQQNSGCNSNSRRVDIIVK